MNPETSRKVLELVRELHQRGYQRIRISPGMSASGMHWRCDITSASNISSGHGARIVDYEGSIAHYSSAEGSAFFGWTDAADSSASELTDRFIGSFPEIVKAGKGKDAAYVKWYREMLKATGVDTFPIAYADCDLPTDHLTTIGAKELKLPLPPPGTAVMDQ